MVYLLLLLWLWDVSGALADSYEMLLDAQNTTVTFSFAALAHTVHGVVPIVPSKIKIDNRQQRVHGLVYIDTTKISTHNKDRDKKMHREVLESARFPDIYFKPILYRGDLQLGKAGQIELVGELYIHGDSHTIEVPCSVDWQEGQLHLSANYTLPYVAWGMKDPSKFIFRVGKEAYLKMKIDAPLIAIP